MLVDFNPVKMTLKCLPNGDVVPEAWKVIDGFRGWYEISNYGRIKSKGRIMYQEKKGEYMYVKLSHGGRRAYLVHRLVGMYFLDKIVGKDLINHRDFDGTNNFYLNLEWCTPSENNMYSAAHGRYNKKAA